MEKQIKKTHSDRKKAESIHSKYVKQKRSEQIWRQFRKNKGAVAGLIVFGIIVLVAIVSSFVLARMALYFEAYCSFSEIIIS